MSCPRRSGAGRCAVTGAIAVLLSVVLAGSGAAQEPGDPPGGTWPGSAGAEEGAFLEAVAFSGAMTPLARLSEDPTTLATEISTSLAYGGALNWWSAGGLGLGIQVMRAPARLHTRATEFQGVIPDDLGDADYRSAVLNVLYRLRFRGAASILEPFFTLGGGIRDLSFDPIAERDVQDATDFVVTGAAGVYARLSRDLWLRLEVRDHLSRFDATPTGDPMLQNDVVASVGVGVRIR